MDNDLAPSKLVEHNGPRFSLIFDDFGPCADAFEARGFEGGGYTWQGVVEALVAKFAPEIADKVKYDPESSMFAAYGTDREALIRVAHLIRDVHQDRALLERVLDSVDLSEYD